MGATKNFLPKTLVGALFIGPVGIIVAGAKEWVFVFSYLRRVNTHNSSLFLRLSRFNQAVDFIFYDGAGESILHPFMLYEIIPAYIYFHTRKVCFDQFFSGVSHRWSTMHEYPRLTYHFFLETAIFCNL